MKEDIEKILKLASNAPSGGNSQPWRFKVQGNVISVLALPEKDHPVLNYRNRGTLVAHGALLENIVISASGFGYEATMDAFPDALNKNIIATIALKKSEIVQHPLFPFIALRATNRKTYHNTLLSNAQKQDLLSSAQDIAGPKVLFAEDKKVREIVGKALAVNEIVSLENKTLHGLFFREIMWTRAQEEKRKAGFYLGAMELKPPQRIMLRLLQYWPVMNFFNKLHFARKAIATENAKVYASGAGVIVMVTEDRDEDFLVVGQVMQRLWLKATQMGLSAHPITGTLYFWQALSSNILTFFSQEHKDMINVAYVAIKKSMGINDGIIAMTLRVGFAEKPTATAMKKEPDIVFL